MRSYYGLTEELISTTGRRETICDTEQWRRWDEEIVEDFGRWLSRIAKTFAILLLVGSAVIVITWLWKIF